MTARTSDDSTGPPLDNSTNPVILVVEDNEDVAYMICETLKSYIVPDRKVRIV